MTREFVARVSARFTAVGFSVAKKRDKKKKKRLRLREDFRRTRNTRPKRSGDGIFNALNCPGVRVRRRGRVGSDRQTSVKVKLIFV